MCFHFFSLNYYTHTVYSLLLEDVNKLGKDINKLISMNIFTIKAKKNIYFQANIIFNNKKY